MKFFALLLSLYVLFLTVTPCCAGDACSETSATEQTTDGCDCCSPFFACGTCSGFTFAAVIVSLKIPEHPVRAAFGEKAQFLDDGIATSFWQPPKFG